MQERLRASGKRRSSPDPEKKKGGTWGVVTLDDGDGEVNSEKSTIYLVTLYREYNRNSHLSCYFVILRSCFLVVSWRNYDI